MESPTHPAPRVMLLRLRCDVERVWACDIRQYVQAEIKSLGMKIVPMKESNSKWRFL